MAEKSCPFCQVLLPITEQNFGTLYTCQSCESVFFIDWEGVPERPLAKDFTQEDESEIQEAVEIQLTPPDKPENDFLSIPAEPLQPSAIAESQDINQDLVQPQPSNLTDEKDFNQGVIEPQSDEYHHDTPADEAGGFGSASNGPSSDIMNEIADFGNSNQGSLPLLYTVKISGIDSGDILKEIKNAISDSRFGWDPKDLTRSIRNGVLEIVNLNPVAAMILVKRLRRIEVEVGWRQNVSI